MFNSCIGKPIILNFKSEYELKHGISPIEEPRLVNYPANESITKAVEREIENNYDKKPIIIVCESDLLEKFTESLKKMKYTYASDISDSTLAQISEWDTGVLLLERSISRGLDTRFKVDSLVLITCEVMNYNELL